MPAERNTVELSSELAGFLREVLDSKRAVYWASHELREWGSPTIKVYLELEVTDA